MKRILIIEDEKVIAELERDYLEAHGYKADFAMDGDSGLRLAIRGEHDLIILDLMLPGMNGFDVCRQIREEHNTPS